MQYCGHEYLCKHGGDHGETVAFTEHRATGYRADRQRGRVQQVREHCFPSRLVTSQTNQLVARRRRVAAPLNAIIIGLQNTASC